MRVADIDEGRIREVVGADYGEASLHTRLAIRSPGTPRLLLTTQDKDAICSQSSLFSSGKSSTCQPKFAVSLKWNV